VYIPCTLGHEYTGFGNDSQVLVAGCFLVFVFLFDALLIQWIELMTTEHDKCRNMNSVNPQAGQLRRPRIARR
jgi:hypothetical protein